MADRILVWHIPTLPAVTPVFYADKDYKPIALRLYTTVPPGAGDMIVDILDDGVSIMDTNDSQKMSFRHEDGYLAYTSLTGTFTIGETVSGGTSGASARIKDNALGNMTFETASATKFTAAEVITGLSSGATATVSNYVAPIHQYTKSTVGGQSHAALRKGASSEANAEDFADNVEIDEGSWVSLSVLDAAGASGITVQLDLQTIAESVELRPSFEGS